MTQSIIKTDPRNFATGCEIPTESYADQPYIVKTDDGAWLCVLTTGRGREGDAGQHVVATRSLDQGQTWSGLVDIEPADGPESSWVMPLKVPSGRVYAIYLHNSDNVREVVTDTGTSQRVDTLGHYVLKHSDDHGRTWSKRRYPIPIRETQIDRDNPYMSKVRFLWGVGKPIIHAGKAYFGFAKVGRFGHGWMASSEGYFLCSDNILTEDDPEKVCWTLLPDGEVGLRAPKGPVADEHNLVSLSDGSLYCTYRTIDGHNCHAYSRDGGHNWDGPQYATYTPGGRRIKHPRAANFVWRCENGHYLLWFHNNGVPWYNAGPPAGNRNVAWLAGGVEKDSFIHWSQPEIVMYTDNHLRGPSYPDLVEDGGRYFIAATQKEEARVLELDPELLESLWQQDQKSSVTGKGLILNLPAAQCEAGSTVAAPELPELSGPVQTPSWTFPLDGREGFTLEVWVRFDTLEPGQVLLDGRDSAGKGIACVTTNEKSVRFEMCDGRAAVFWESDKNLVTTGRDIHIVVVVDGGPKVISFIVNGLLCDGGNERYFGWGRFYPFMQNVNGAEQWTLAPNLRGELKSLRVYDRYLHTSEAVEDCRAGFGAKPTKPTRRKA